jgi:hypothetical protein
MPTRRIRARSAKRARARHLPKHSPELSLDVDAASGTYGVDEIAVEFYKMRVFLEREPFELSLKKLRRAVDFAGCHSLGLSQAELLRAPERHRLTKRLFDDVKTISHLIERNKNLDPLDFMLSVKYIHLRAGSCADRSSSLLTKLRDVRAEIEGFLADYGSKDGRGGNRDPLSYNFMSEMLRVWRDFADIPPEQAAAERAYVESLRDVPEMFRSEYRPFARLLAAAWRDLEFPLLDHRNVSREPLEDWFTDRVRKQFPDDGLSAEF